MSGQPWEKTDQDKAHAYRECAKDCELVLLRRTRAQCGAHKGRTRGTFPPTVWSPLTKETKREMAATCLLARGLEWLLPRLAEARHWSQYAVRHNPTVSSNVKLRSPTASFEQAHKVIMECTSQQLTHCRQQGTPLLERAEQLVDAWAALWSNAQQVDTDDEIGQQACHMEESHLEDASLVVMCQRSEVKPLQTSSRREVEANMAGRGGKGLARRQKPNSVDHKNRFTRIPPPSRKKEPS